MKIESKNIIWSLIVIAIIIVLWVTVRRGREISRPEPPARPLSQAEILKSLTAPADAKINIDPKVIESLTAPPGAKTVIDKRILDSLTPGKNPPRRSGELEE